MDATGTAVRETQFRGCSQASLYNTVRPHSSLGYLTPEEFAASWRAAPDKQQQPDAAPRPATGRAAAVLGASASRPVAGTPTAGQTENRTQLMTGGKLGSRSARVSTDGQTLDVQEPCLACSRGGEGLRREEWRRGDREKGTGSCNRRLGSRGTSFWSQGCIGSHLRPGTSSTSLILLARLGQGSDHSQTTGPIRQLHRVGLC